MLLSAVDDHRAQINGITTLAERDITGYASTLLNESPDAVAAQLRPAAKAVVSRWGDVAAVSGALWYETERPAAGFTAPLAAPSLGDELAGALGWAFAPLYSPDDFPNGPGDMIPRLAGVVQKYVANTDRETVHAAAKRDPLSTGVDRYVRGVSVGGCAFCCLMAAQSARGGHWHSNCKCVEVPSWRDSPLPDSEAQNHARTSAYGAIKAIEHARAAHPDYGSMRSRQFFAAHPELALTNKNITRVMRELYGFAH